MEPNEIAKSAGHKASTSIGMFVITLAVFAWRALLWPLALPFHFLHGFFAGAFGADMKGTYPSSETAAEAFAFYLTLGLYIGTVMTILNVKPPL